MELEKCPDDAVLFPEELPVAEAVLLVTVPPVALAPDEGRGVDGTMATLEDSLTGVAVVLPEAVFSVLAFCKVAVVATFVLPPCAAEASAVVVASVDVGPRDAPRASMRMGMQCSAQSRS